MVKSAIYGLIGTEPEQPLPANQMRGFFQINNNSLVSSGKILGYTTDGSEPVIHGQSTSLIYPCQGQTPVEIPTGPIRIVGNEPDTAFSLSWS